MKTLKEIFKRIILVYKMYFGKKNKITNYNQKNIYIFLAADYRNLGDVAITYAQKKFLQDNFEGFNVVEIPAQDTISYILDLKKNIKQQDIITIVGGGNMGNIYEYYEAIRRVIIRTFKKNLIISFPQTIDFTNDKKGDFSKKLTKRTINKCKNIIIFAREKNSYEIMKKLFKCPVFLAPDIVLYLSKYEYITSTNKNKKNIGICFREDKEKNKTGKELRKKIIKELNNTENFTTYLEENDFKYEERYELLMALIKKISSFEYVVTDRLHAMIFAFLTNTKCYFIDNSNHKISETKKTWLPQTNNIIQIKSREDIKKITKEKLNEKNEVYLNLQNEFEKMKKIIYSYCKEEKNGDK